MADDYSDKMKFRMFRWLENPEQFGIRAVCAPEYEENGYGAYDYTGMGPMCRVYTGKGVFCGPDAVQQFNGLAVLGSCDRSGEIGVACVVDTSDSALDMVMCILGKGRHSHHGHQHSQYHRNGQQAFKRLLHTSSS